MCHSGTITAQRTRSKCILVRRNVSLESMATRTASVGPYVVSCQMFVKSEFPLDSALVCDSDQKKFGWHFFRKP